LKKTLVTATKWTYLFDRHAFSLVLSLSLVLSFPSCFLSLSPSLPQLPQVSVLHVFNKILHDKGTKGLDELKGFIRVCILPGVYVCVCVCVCVCSAQR
jgi:hypothetical protein